MKPLIALAIRRLGVLFLLCAAFLGTNVGGQSVYGEDPTGVADGVYPTEIGSRCVRDVLQAVIPFSAHYDRWLWYGGTSYIGWSYESGGSKAYSAYTAMSLTDEMGKYFIYEDMTLCIQANFINPKRGRNFAIFGAHGKYDSDFFAYAFGLKLIPPGGVGIASSCNVGPADAPSPLEVVARYNPGRPVVGINPNLSNTSVSINSHNGKIDVRFFESGSELSKSAVLAIGKYNPENQRFYWRELPDDSVQEYVKSAGIKLKRQLETPSNVPLADARCSSIVKSTVLPSADASSIPKGAIPVRPGAVSLGLVDAASQEVGSSFGMAWASHWHEQEKANNGDQTSWFWSTYAFWSDDWLMPPRSHKEIQAARFPSR